MHNFDLSLIMPFFFHTANCFDFVFSGLDGGPYPRPGWWAFGWMTNTSWAATLRIIFSLTVTIQFLLKMTSLVKTFYGGQVFDDCISDKFI